nr:hypothetical protein [Halomicroarcula amylolytica]
MIEAERLVRDTLGARLKPNRVGLGRRPVADETRDLERVDPTAGVDAEDADVEFPSQRPSGLGDSAGRCRDVRGVRFVEPVVGLDDAALDVDAATAGVPLRFDGDERRLVPQSVDGEEVVVQYPDPDEVRISRPDADVVERSERLRDSGIDRLVGEPPLGGELRVSDDVPVVGVRWEEASLRVRENSRLS